MHIEVVVNPIHAEGLRVCGRVRELCRESDATLRVRPTSPGRPHGGVDASAADLVVVIGGDGTLREVAGHLHTRGAGGAGDLEPSPLLPVPTGTADLFAYNVGMRTTRRACAVLGGLLRSARAAGGPMTKWASAGWREVSCDLGWARLRRASGRMTPKLPFLAAAGIGHSGTAIMRTPVIAKRLLGPAGYGTGALRTLMADPWQLCVVTAPVLGCASPVESRFSLPLWSVEFGNIRGIPGGVTVFPHGGVGTGSLAMLGARVAESRKDRSGGAGDRNDDGGIDAGPFAFRRLRRMQDWVDVFRAGLRGGHAGVSALTLATAEQARVTSARPVPVHLDGEAAGWATGLQVGADPGALRVVSPASVE